VPGRDRAPHTKQYLEAASRTLVGGAGGAFQCTKQVLSGDTAVLEFETSVEGKYVNGVDITRCDDAGRIVEFRVMMRPLAGDPGRERADGPPAADGQAGSREDESPAVSDRGAFCCVRGATRYIRTRLRPRICDPCR
jgi:hypothetical protein